MSDLHIGFIAVYGIVWDSMEKSWKFILAKDTSTILQNINTIICVVTVIV